MAALAEQLTSANANFASPDPSVLPSFVEAERTFGKACPVIFRCSQNRKTCPADWSPGVKVKPDRIGQDPGVWELALHAREMEDGRLELRCAYAPEVYAEKTVRRWMTHFRLFLENLAAGQGRNLQKVDLLAAAERDQMVYEWNRTEKAYPSDACLHELIEAQVRRSPGATALLFGADSLTYDGMNRRANRLANHLRSAGVRPESIVAVLAERSLDTIVGLVAVLKAGGAYLPLDPSHPSERLGALLRDARPVVVLAQVHLAKKLTGHNVKVVVLGDGFEAESDANLPNLTTPDNAAYVIYTSGSTGIPKGVVNIHRGICNYVTWWRDYLKLTPGDRFLQKIPFTFDPSVAEIFGTLTAGAALVVAHPGRHGDTRYLIETVCERQVTAAFFVPSLLAAFVQDEQVTRCASLRLVVSGGEALSAELSDEFATVLPAAELINIYGPTEAVIAVTAWRCERPSGGRTVPIGGPIQNTSLYILDPAMQPVPIGVAGELHIGGVQVARGYLNQAALTAEKFVENPFAPGRLYKTGDLCRFRADGMIEFLRRIDHQVKLRGYRIEPGEIEAVLKQFPAVRDAVVMVRADEQAPGGQLLAYVIGKGVVTEDLRLHARHFLPDYMVPAVFVLLERFPVTVNGKLDRDALPGPEFGQGEPQKVQPRDALEAQLLNIWREVLRQPALGVTDGFFEFGGHSILALEIVTQIARKLRRTLPLSALFEVPTVTGLAQALREQRSDLPAATIVPVQPRGARPPFFCVHDGFGSCMYFRKLADGLGPAQPFYGFLLRENLARFGTVDSVRQLAAHYVAELVRIRPDGPLQLGGFCTGGVIAHEMACQLRVLGREVSLLALIDANNPLCPPRRQSIPERLRSRH
ncbi:MAG TPA: amino acid adenylation domain-containing protein, partial [Chthoniobacterales bacterium]